MALKVPNPYQPTATETVNVNGTSPSDAKMSATDVSNARTISWSLGAAWKPAFETKSATGVPTVSNGKPTSYTGNVTPEGAENPYTGGVETASPKGTLYGVNQGVYSPENKQKAWTAAGGAGTYNPDAFYRGTNGEMLIKEGAIAKPSAPVGTLTPSAVSTPAVPSAATGITGISQVDTELDKLKKDKQKAIDDAYKSYELAKGSIEQNKGYYTNFDDVNARFTNVTNDVKNAMQAKGETFLTDDEYQKIADKYGIGLSEVKNPVSVFNALNLSDEGKTKLGVSKYDQGVADLKTAYERQKADIATSLANTERNMNAQIDDAANSINRNLGAMAAQGAWSGAQRSTAYSQGLENVRSDGSNLIKRMNDQLANTQTQSHLEVSRLGEDLEKNLTRSKQDLDNQLQTMKFDNGLKLSEATAKYGTGSVELTKALDAIKEEFGTKSLDVYNKYLSSVKATNDLTTQKLDQISKIDDLTTKLADRRYNEYLANNGQLLTNTSLTNVHQELVNGTITPKRYDDLRNVMQNSVVSTLGKFGTVSEHDVNAISHMLDTGSTPTQIVAQMRGLPQYQKKVVDKVIDLGTKKRIQYADGSFEDIAETKSPISVTAGNDLYDPNTGTFITRPTGAAGTSGSTVGAGIDFRDAVSKYPNEASVKNNNPAGITYNDAFAQRLKDAGIQFTVGTARPSAEGGNYFGFPDVQNGLKAYKLLWSSPSYQNLTVGSALARWGTDSVPGVDNSKKVSELTPAEFSQLQIAQMKKESPGFYKEMVARGMVGAQGFNVPETSAGFTESQKNMMDGLMGKSTVTKDDFAKLLKAGVDAPQYYDYVASKKWNEGMSERTEYSNSDLALLSKIDTLTKETKATLADAGLSEKDWAKFQDGQLPPTGSQKKTAIGIVDAIDALEKHDGLSDAVGFKGLQTGYTVPGSYKADFLAKFNAFRDQLVLPNLGQLKGPMSDKDVVFLRNTATSLSPDMSENEFKATLDQLRKKYQEIVDKSASSGNVSQTGTTGTDFSKYTIKSK